MQNPVDEGTRNASPQGRKHYVPSVSIETTPGELLDRITILEIKAERIEDVDKQANVIRELACLQTAERNSIPRITAVIELRAQLRTVNLRLWDIEDTLRDCERAGHFDDRFIQLARSVYKVNDERAVLKKRVNTLLGASFSEEKSYSAY